MVASAVETLSRYFEELPKKEEPNLGLENFLRIEKTRLKIVLNFSECFDVDWKTFGKWIYSDQERLSQYNRKSERNEQGDLRGMTPMGYMLGLVNQWRNQVPHFIDDVELQNDKD